MCALFALNCIADQLPDSIVLVRSGAEDFPQAQYTLTFKGLQLPHQGYETIIKLRTGSNSQGGDLHITSDRITFVTGTTETVIAEQMPEPLEAHDYTICKFATMRIYRDGTLYGTAQPKTYSDGDPRVVVVQPPIKYEFEITSSTANITPDETAYETNLGNMLTGFTNLSTDPYLNTGFDRSGQDAGGRGFTTLNAKNNGWGSDIWVSTDAYSGPCCVKLEGQSKYSSQGAALKQSIDFAARTPYVVRAMVKSDGWEGMLGIADEENFIHITDTKGEWKQVEGVLIPRYQWNGTSFETLYVHNADYESNGTLLIDNLEVYKGSTGINNGSNGKALVSNVAAGTLWNPTSEVDVYRLGMNETSSEEFSQVNMENVSISGAPYFTRNFEGSKMYAIYLPYSVGNVTVTGSFDYRDHYEYHLYHGLDFICQRFDSYTGRFTYMNAEDKLTPGGYIIQFADNYDGMPVRFDMVPGTARILSIAENLPYTLNGNDQYKTIAVETPNTLFFDEDKQQFNQGGSTNSSANALRPFLPYITAPEGVKVISPDGTTGIQILNAAKGNDSRYIVRCVSGGLEICGHGTSRQSIYNLAGQRIKSVTLNEGINHVSLAPGIYIVCGKKVMVK